MIPSWGLTINCTWHLFLSLIPPTQKSSGYQPQSTFLPWASLEAGSSLCHLIDGVEQYPQVWNLLLLEPRETQKVVVFFFLSSKSFFFFSIYFY